MACFCANPECSYFGCKIAKKQFAEAVERKRLAEDALEESKFRKDVFGERSNDDQAN